MSDPAFAVILLVEFVGGALGAVALGRWLPQFSSGSPIDAFVGGPGGLVFTWLAARIPSIGRLVGHVETAVDGAMRGTGGVTPMILIGAGVAGLIGGSSAMLLFGLARRWRAG